MTYLFEPMAIPGRSTMPRQQIPLMQVSGADGSRLTMGTKELLDPGELLDDTSLCILVDRVKSLHRVPAPADEQAG